MKVQISLTLLLVLVATSCFAGYQVTGKMTGEECTSYVLFEKCSTKKIDAIKGNDGSLHSLPRYFKKVSSYRNGLCWIRIKSRQGGLVAFGVNLTKPDLYEKQPDGKYKYVDVESIVFKCREE